MQSAPDPSRHNRRNLRRAFIGTVAAGALLVACGDDGDAVSSTGTTAAPETTVAPDNDTVTVELEDFTFVGLPDSVEAGTTFEIVNKSKSELHELVAVQLPDSETRSAEQLGKLPAEELMALFTGEPAMVLLAGPDGGEQVNAVGDGTLSEPGRYFIVCMIPTGVDPDEYLNAPPSDGPPVIENAGPPHLVHGMYAEITVE